MARTIEIERLPIRLTGRGQWLHGDTPMHPRVAALFARNIVPDADGGYTIVIDIDREPIEVEDAAFFVESMHLQETEKGLLRSVELLLSDGTKEELAPSTLMISDENVLYARILRHGLLVPCRFPPSLYHRLALYVEEDGDDFVLPVSGVRHSIGPHSREPVCLDAAASRPDRLPPQSEE